jgi:uncharacterized protein (DUF1697 family)
MPVYVSLLRAVNVAKRTVPMADLRGLYEELGHTDVVTYVQSGNVVSRAGTRTAAAVERDVSAALRTIYGFDVDVFVRTAAQLQAVLDSNPFLGGLGPVPAPKTLHVTFLARAPGASVARALDGQEFAPDVFELRGREVYLSCPNGYGRTKITNAWFERRLRMPATTRNWNTVTKLHELAG